MNLQFSGSQSEEEKQKTMQLRMACVELAVRYTATLSKQVEEGYCPDAVKVAAKIEDYVLNGASKEDE